MPLDPANDRRPPINPQLAVRVAGAGVIAFALFGIIFFRLWYLQVLDGDKYLAQARDNRVRTQRIDAPRGTIVDASGVTLVDNRKATVVAINPASIDATMRTDIANYGQLMTARSKKPKGHQGPRPPMPMAVGDLKARYQRLARVLNMGWKTINERVVSSILQVPYANVRVKTDIPTSQRNYIQERQEMFRGVTVEEVYVRKYPAKEMAAQLLGTLGQISKTELKSPHFKNVPGGTDVGKTGLEYEYDKALRGTDGEYRIEVNAAGERRRAVTARQPKQGRTLKLTLDSKLQAAGEAALRDAGGGLPGAFVALNPQTGAIYAMGSSPSYNPLDAMPGRYSTTAAYKAKFVDASTEHPLINRADESAYPTGSIFKPITSLAALAAGVITPTTPFNDEGCLKVGARQLDVKCNAGKTPYGTITMAQALQVSSDTYYYNLGLKLYDHTGEYLQKWAHKLGVARPTGVDLPYEAGGSIPSAEAVVKLQDAERACRKKRHVKSCGIAFLDSSWNPGDEANFAVGQGGLQATPLQMAVAYSTIIDNGRVITPHLGASIENIATGVTEPIDKPSRRKVDINPSWRTTILDGLFAAANKDKGTSQAVWADDWPKDKYPIYGKTGTAERNGQRDQSWYVGYSYDHTPDKKPIVVVATIEKGGFGAAAAAPAVRLIMSKWFGVHAKLVRGESTDR
ncbi:MAG TPA: penicillin-binding transpeptidase domain-containing protein [Baekduia sp.]|uniref:penicillin-binding transpeptidase domain-containing protein n=1 Tax=Baekduia sp. TaxID=2600305 RepID=UPI002D7964CC|nr:penicillin-binding transpeptidase domain-containing protein [Baekduia sp.]HET6508205.1 penicillin-binding transpeptidase domain-containing protein [Baekduia sp.]